MKYIFITILCVYPLWGFTQNSKIVDSLETLLLENKENTVEKVEILHELVYQLQLKDINRAISYANESYELSIKLNDTISILTSMFYLARNYYFLDSNALSLKYSLELEKRNDNKKDIKWSMYALQLQRMVYSRMSNYQKMTEIGLRRLSIAKTSNKPSSIGKAKLSLGLSHLEAGEDSIAILYYKSAMKDYKSVEDKRGMMSAHLNLGNSFRKTNKLDSALFHLELGLKNALLSKNDLMASKFYSNISSLENKKENYKEAIEYSLKSIEYSKKHSNTMNDFYIEYNILGNSYMFLNQLDSALFYLLEAEKKLNDTKNPRLKKGIYNNLADLYYKRKEYKNAHDKRMVVYNMVDSLYMNSSKKYLAESRVKFDVLENEKKIAQQKLQLTEEKAAKTKIFLGGLLALLLASGIYLWYYQRQKRKKFEVEQALLIEREKAENIRKLDKLKDQFFTNISHELRTPLTLITDPLGKVLQKPISDLDKDDIRLAHNNSQKLLSLINEIMDLSKLDAGKVKLKKSNIHINNALRRQLMAFESLAGIRNISLDFNSEIEDDILISTDYKMLEKIVNNLVSNAVKFSHNNGKVEMSLMIKKDTVLIKVKDNGQGISDEDQNHVFDRFYQGEQESFQGGTGVGLALSKELSELLGGKISIESEVGTGSIFTLFLPYSTLIMSSESNKDIKNNEKEIMYESLTLNGEKPKILIVEDNVDMSDYLYKILSDTYQCTKALNGMEAIKSMQKIKFELILSDVMMPGMDGFELRKKSMQIFKNESIPYVFLTARNLDDDIMEGLRLGVDDYITKPFNSDELKVRIYNLIKNKIERDEWNASDKNTDKRLDDAEDIRFIKKIEKVIFNHMSNPSFNVESLASDLALSTRQLGRRVKSITGLTPVAFILEMRLQKARQLIERKTYNNLNDIRYEIGIESSSYFNKKYKERFGVSPSEIMKK